MAQKDKKQRAQEIFESDEYLKKVLAYVPEAEREEALSRVGGYVLKQDEFNRLADEVRTKDEELDAYKAKLDEWYGASVQAIEQGTAAKKKLDELEKGGRTQPTPGNGATTQAPAGLTPEELTTILNKKQQEIEQRGLGAMFMLQELGFRHYDNFKEKLNVKELFDFAGRKNLAPDQAYNELYKDRYAELNKKQQDAERDKIRKEIREEVQKEMRGSQLPYSVGAGTEPIGDTLAGLSNADRKKAYSVDNAIAEYYRSKQT